MWYSGVQLTLQCTYLNVPCNPRKTRCRTKRPEIWGLWRRVARHMGYLWPWNAQGHMVHLVHLLQNVRLAVEWNWVKIGDTSKMHLWPCSFQGHFKSFRALVSKWPIARKRPVVERSGVAFGTRGQKKHKYGLLKVFNVILGSFMTLVQHIEANFDLVVLNVVSELFTAFVS